MIKRVLLSQLTLMSQRQYMSHVSWVSHISHMWHIINMSWVQMSCMSAMWPFSQITLVPHNSNTSLMPFMTCKCPIIQKWHTNHKSHMSQASSMSPLWQLTCVTISTDDICLILALLFSDFVCLLSSLCYCRPCPEAPFSPSSFNPGNYIVCV